MSNPITNDAQTRLLFKQFMGVATTELDSRFDAESYNFVPNIFSKDVMIEEVPSSPPIMCSTLDSSSNWLDSSSNYSTNTVEESAFAGPGPDNGKTFSQIYPDSNLKFYKRLSLVPVTSGSYGRVWGSFTDYSSNKLNKDSVLEHAIPFKFDDIDGGYLPVVYRNDNSSGSYSNYPEYINSNPTYWLMDAGSGYLIFYASTTTLESNNIKDETDSADVQDPLKAPRISCFVYNGKLGITNLDVSGQVQVGDISGALTSIGHIDRMILADGSANILDLCGNDAIRSQYNYVRKNMFVGYPEQPIIDNSNVDHTQDPSHNDLTGNTVTYELDISGNSYFSGKISHGTSFADGTNSVAFGTNNRALNTGSFAIGNDCSANNNYTLASGQQTMATGLVSHSEGLLTDASGSYSHAEGQGTISVQLGSHAEGVNTRSYGLYSHSEGHSSESWGQYSHSSGLHTIIGENAGTSMGKYNDTSKNVLLVVGDGTSHSNRSDAFLVNTDGSVEARHRVGISGNLVTSENSNVYINEEGVIESVGGSRFVDYKAYFSADISGSIMGSGNDQWFCIATIPTSPLGEMANGLFILDDNTSGLRQTIVFRAGSNYARGNFIDVLSNNYYGRRINGIKIDVSGNPESGGPNGTVYQGANLFIKRAYTTNPTFIYVRVYQNKRKGNSGNVGFWNLTTTPIPNLNETQAEIDLTFNPGGQLGGNKATTLHTLIDAQLKVNEKTTLTDVSASALSTTGDITVGGDLNVSGSMTYSSATFSDLTGVNLTLSDQLNIKDTYILTKNNTPERYNPTTPFPPLPYLDWYEIAFVDNTSIAPGTNNDVENVTAYFTFTNNRNTGGPSSNTSKQVIHFLAGIFYDQNEPKPFVKVFSNSFNAASSKVANIAIGGIGSAPNNETLYLLLGFDGTSGIFMEDCEIRMYKNSYGLQRIDPVTNRFSGGGWIMGNKSNYVNTGPLFEPSVKSQYPAGFTTYLNLQIDNKPVPNAYSTLFETFTKDVDISNNLNVGNTFSVQGDSTLEGLTVRDICCNTLTGGDISSNDTLLVQKKSHTIATADPSGWFLIAECDDLRNVNGSKPNMAYTVNNGLFQLNATMNWNTNGYGVANRYNQNITFILGMGLDDRVSLNVLNQNNIGNGGGGRITYSELSIYKDTVDNKFKLWARYNPLTPLSTYVNKNIFITSRLELNNENKGLTDGYQVNWNLKPFNYRSIAPVGTLLHNYNISDILKPSHFYQTQPLINTDSVIVDNNSLIKKVSSIPFPASGYSDAFICQCVAYNNSSPGSYVEIACNGMFKLRAKHSIGGVPYIQEIVFNAAFTFSGVTSSDFGFGHSLNLISHTKTKPLISKIRLFGEAMTGLAPQIGGRAFVKIVLNTGITSLNGGLEVTSYNNDKNDGTSATEEITQNHWRVVEGLIGTDTMSTNKIVREIDLTETDISSSTIFNTDVLAANNLRLGMIDTSSCLITKDINELPVSTIRSTLLQDGVSNLILESNDGGVVINASTRGRNGGLTLINSGDTTDQNNYSRPEFKIITLDDNYSSGSYWESKWGNNNSGNTYLYGAASTSMYSGTSQGSSFGISVGNSAPNTYTSAIKMKDTSIGGSGYPSDWIISLNDNGNISSRNNVSTYINTPSFNVYNNPKNPAFHVDSNDDTVKFNAPVIATNGASIANTLDVSSISVNSLTTNVSALLPSNTQIFNRGVLGNYKTLKADGYQEFSFDTQNVNPNDWISIAWVGPRSAQSQKQRADAKFEFINNMSGTHQTICLRASHHFSRGQCIDIIKNVRYGNGSKRQIKAFRMSYAGIYDGGILQMQIGDDDTSTDQLVIQLKISENYNDYGWFCDISGSPSADNTPSGYNSGTGNTLSTGGGFNNFSLFFPSSSGINVLERVQTYHGLTSIGKSTLMYTSDIIANKIYMRDDLDMSGNNINMNGGAINGLAFDTLTLQNNTTIDDASGALVTSNLKGSLAYATITPTLSNGNPGKEQSVFLYRGGNNKNYYLGSPTRVRYLIDWDGTSSGGTQFTLNPSGSRAIKTAAYAYDPNFYTSTGVTQYWYPMARGFISAVKLENMNTKMEFNNSTGQTQQVRLEIWVLPISAYASMTQGNNTQYACRAISNTFSISNGISSKYFGNSSSGALVRLKHNIPTSSSSGQVGYFDEDDYMGVYWVFSVVGGYSGGSVKVTPKRTTSINSGFNRSGVTFNAIMSQELLN